MKLYWCGKRISPFFDLYEKIFFEMSYEFFFLFLMFHVILRKEVQMMFDFFIICGRGCFHF